MAAKFVVILSLAVAASAIPLVPVAKVAYAEHEAPAHYEFEYSVHDDHTGDVKQQKEARHGDAVQGSYSLIQPDGVLRVVDYTSDKEHGFNAIVRYEGHPAPAPAPTKVIATPVHYAAPAKVIATPVYHAAPAKVVAAPVYHHSPVYHSAPVAKVTYAPVAKVAYAPVAKVAYTAPLGHVTFSSPAISYHH